MRIISLIGCLLMPAMASAATLSDYQVIGSHNSYKRALPSSVLAFLQAEHPRLAQQINYSHIPLKQQLALGLRQLEIDVVNDPQGNQYDQIELAQRFHEQWFSEAELKALAKPGFKVMHIPHVDVMTDCISFADCLTTLVDWSQANPKHFPVLVTLNAKENQPDFISQKAPAPFTAESYAALDAEIRGILQDKLITPDAIRGEHNTLRDAVLHNGWPDIDALRGKFIFLFDASAHQRELYADDHPSLRGRSMFAAYPADKDEAAIMVLNEPARQQAEIRERVSQGFLVRTRADADFTATPQQMQEQFEYAQRSGAQFISTDFYPHSAQARHTGYQVQFADGDFVRANPLTK
ncbi:Ca2+-dependent phosphoinositide-specific phospholipase C [Alteromonas lipolytica]|uniref:Calcium-dependent phosphoinositide phospholipase C n=1 Tax=Alteromonas lipolytica TaxID=1856405 RepID=A0A1E8F9R5_9ALTE|nr:Ca2+-dependent phosphoinositide-specific phospholipase C [Alteromonas lipolytica]OFI32283.1 hypothetical protein BFC17_07475 [Alteromonas lipolytica]GGF85814.1 hypothetical protein GCM10011338_42670 [Alteromonas lipolytica]